MNGTTLRRALTLLLLVPALRAGEPPTLALTIKDHRFDPPEVRVKAGKPVYLEVSNLDGTPEEFEMLPLAIEKVIPAGAKARIRLRPLGPGRYEFVGDFHKDTAKGAVVAE
jgi:hypothetical protein